MKMNMKITEAQGFNKQKAFDKTGLNTELDMLKNATQSWKKAGSPIGGAELKEFMSDYIKSKKALGGYIVVDQASDDTRKRPYSVINEVTAGKRKAKTIYQVKEANFNVKYNKAVKIVVDKESGEEKEVEFLTPYHTEVITATVKDKESGEMVEIEKEVEATNIKVSSVGSVEGRANRKNEAFKLMKELIEANKKNYVVEIVKEITDGQKYAGYGIYTPSKSAKEGKFIFFTND